MSSPEAFISEPLEPLAGTFATAAMASGVPGLPAGFIWRDDTFHITEILSQWKESGPCTHSQERYLRKHWYHIRTDDHREMKIYFERQARSKGQTKQRWWLYTIVMPTSTS